MVEKNHDKWHGKAKIVGISLDDDTEAPQKRVEEKKWQGIEHYQAPGGFQAEAIKAFSINGIPTVLLVDGTGKIVFRGHPSECNLEERINALIGGDAAPTAAGAGASAGGLTLSFEDERVLLAKVREKHESTKGLLPGNMKNNYFVVVVTNKVKNGAATISGRAIYGGTCVTEDFSKSKEYMHGLLDLIPPGFEKKPRLSKVINKPISYGTQCATCKAALGKSVPHYVCTACDKAGKADHAFCVACVEKETTAEIKSGADLQHPHGLLYVNEHMEATLKEPFRVFNEAIIVDEHHARHKALAESGAAGGVYCDGCGGPVKHYRYACSHCRDFDLCLECFNVSRNASHEKYAQFKEDMLKKKHDVVTHALYRGHFFMIMRQEDPIPIEF
jgi:hypothetical protein